MTQVRFLIFAVVLALAGCTVQGATSSSSVPAGIAGQTPLGQVKPLADPRAHVGPSTAVMAQPDIVPVHTNPQPQLPATITDAQGTKVTVTSADRILAFDMYGTLAATVFGLGLGDRVVGRDVSTGFPAAQKLPVITANGHQLSAEAIMRLRPTVVLTDTTMGPWDVVLQLRDSGIPVVVTDSKRNIDNIGTIVHSVADALGVPEVGRELSARIAQQIGDIKSDIAKLAPAENDRRLRVAFLYLRGQSGVYYMFGKGSGADALITALSARDVATEVGLDGVKPINPEALAKAQPDVLMVMTKGLESVGGVDGVLGLPGVAQTPAGRNRRVVDMSDQQVLSFGPLTPNVLDALARVLYAPDQSK